MPRHASTNPLMVVNPAARGGAGGAAWRRWVAPVEGAFGETIDLLGEQRRPTAEELARRLADCRAVVVAGGDGTVGDVVTALMARAQPRPRMAIVPLGTGNDIARSMGLTSPEQALAAIEVGATRSLDVIEVTTRVGGRRQSRYACLTSNVGFSPEVLRRTRPWMKRLLGPDAAYLLGTLAAIPGYGVTQMRVECDGRKWRGGFWMVNVGNAEWESGGSMRVSPGALVDDGLANVCLVHACTKLRVVRKLPLVYTGAHVDEPEVTYFTARHVCVDSEPPAWVAVDGDVHGQTPADFMVVPSAVEVFAQRR